MKRATLFVLAAAALAAVVPARPAAAKELAGVTMPDTLTVAGKTLKLNGMGLRKKMGFKVYVGGLYLEAPSSDAKAILAADAPKALKMHFLRSVDRRSSSRCTRRASRRTPGRRRRPRRRAWTSSSPR